jgi:hypothetical protein
MCTMPSPQRGGAHLLVQLLFSSASPSSHCSAGPRTPSPQMLTLQASLHAAYLPLASPSSQALAGLLDAVAAARARILAGGRVGGRRGAGRGRLVLGWTRVAEAAGEDDREEENAGTHDEAAALAIASAPRRFPRQP